jgi:subtilisin family serine protease
MHGNCYAFFYRNEPKPERIQALGGSITYIGQYSPLITAYLPDHDLIAGLREDQDLMFVEKDQIYQLPYFKVEHVLSTNRIRKYQIKSTQVIPWNIERVTKGKCLWRGSGVRVGVIDTGIDLTHPDLAANIRGGVNILSPNIPPQDLNGHGTHIAGIIGALNNRIGVVGVAPRVSLYPIKVLNSQGIGTLANLIKGIEWGISNRMHILNISISGGKKIPRSLSQAVSSAMNRGIAVVAAAGNSGSSAGKGDSVEIPARIPSCIAVAALNKLNRRASFSATGRSVTIAAPGENILSTYIGKQYAVLSGTSMAAAHVSGVLAVFRQMFPKYPLKSLIKLMISRAIDLPPKGWDPYTGVGLVQV